MKRPDCEQSQYYQADFLASHSVQPGSGEARRMTVTSGRRCLELYRRSDPVGSLVRMLLESSHWRSTRCYLTWKASATPARRLLFRLAPSMPRTDETVVPFWPTPITPRPHDSENMAGKYLPSQKQKDLSYAVAMWPTPKSSDSKGTGPVGSASQTHDAKKGNLRGVVLEAFATPQARDGSRNHTGQLANFVKLIPTVTTGAEMCGRSANYQWLKEMEEAGVISEEERRSMAAGNGGQMNPTWVEWLMGFPIGWTDLNASETP